MPVPRHTILFDTAQSIAGTQMAGKCDTRLPGHLYSSEVVVSTGYSVVPEVTSGILNSCALTFCSLVLKTKQKVSWGIIVTSSVRNSVELTVES